MESFLCAMDVHQTPHANRPRTVPDPYYHLKESAAFCCECLPPAKNQQQIAQDNVHIQGIMEELVGFF